ncbi:MAG: glycerate kinase [Alphaproteobacteria bacterium]|nr:glycerate kinase [Alphaproteobacteria bacterium]
MNSPTVFLQRLFEAAIGSAQPAVCVPPYLPERPAGRLVVVGAGKASAAMARAVERNWRGPLEGLVVTRYGHAAACDRIEIVEAAHPVPDQNGLEAASRMLELVAGLTENDTLLGLFSGGGSALLPAPIQGVTLADKQDINRQLLTCGATIAELNCVRRHFSRIKGGGLARAAGPAKIVNLLISDVPGDNPLDIASGPLVADTTSATDALDVINRFGIRLPAVARASLEDGNTPTDQGAMPAVETHVIASPQQSLAAAAELCRSQGIPVHILSDRIEGEAKDVGVVMAGLARQIACRSEPFVPPCVLLSGGETTVTVKGTGKGGRNVAFLLSFSLAIEGVDGVYALAGDTDGIDGLEAIAGATCDPTTLARARQIGINPRTSLGNDDGHGFFHALGDSIVTGPPRTNVNDFRAILVTGK